MPPAVAYLTTLLPPPTYFHGPFVAVDKLMEVFHRLQIPDRPPHATGEGVDPSVFDIAKGANWNPEIHDDTNHTKDHQQNNRGGRGRGFKRKGGDDKRHHNAVGGHESEDDESGIAPPINDIYRSRQQKRVKS